LSRSALAAPQPRPAPSLKSFRSQTVVLQGHRVTCLLFIRSPPNAAACRHSRSLLHGVFTCYLRQDKLRPFPIANPMRIPANPYTFPKTSRKYQEDSFSAEKLFRPSAGSTRRIVGHTPQSSHHQTLSGNLSKEIPPTPPDSTAFPSGWFGFRQIQLLRPVFGGGEIGFAIASKSNANSSATAPTPPRSPRISPPKTAHKLPCRRHSPAAPGLQKHAR